MDIVGYIIGMLGIIVAMVIYILSKKEKCPVYLISNTSIIGQQYALLSKEDKITIRFNDTQINQLSICNILLINIGKQTIDSNDIADSDPLRLIFAEGSKILKAYVVKSKREAINFRIVSYKKNVLNFTFDFLDAGDGALIKVVYDGSLTQSSLVKGTIKGASKGFVLQKEGSDKYERKDTYISLFLIGLGLSAGYMGIAPYLLGVKPLPDFHISMLILIPLYLLFVGIFLSMGIGLFYSNHKRKQYNAWFNPDAHRRKW
jgi:hypothetical protein